AVGRPRHTRRSRRRVFDSAEPPSEGLGATRRPRRRTPKAPRHPRRRADRVLVLRRQVGQVGQVGRVGRTAKGSWLWRTCALWMAVFTCLTSPTRLTSPAAAARNG